MSIELRKEPTKTGRTLDLTPSWESLAFHIATLAIDGTTFDSRKIGREELTRMARLADKWVEHQKEESTTEKLEKALAQLDPQSRANIQAIREKHGAPEALNAIADGFGLCKPQNT